MGATRSAATLERATAAGPREARSTTAGGLQDRFGNRGLLRLLQARRGISQPTDAVCPELEGLHPPLALQQAAGNTAVASVLGGDAGRPLPASLRAEAESRFGHDFAAVRIHTGAPAGEVAGRLGARAFAYGAEVVFADGQFSPETAAGKRLVGHELAHVVQQSRGGASPPPARGGPLERAAARAGDAFAAEQQHVPVSGASAPGMAASWFDEVDEGHTGQSNESADERARLRKLLASSEFSGLSGLLRKKTYEARLARLEEQIAGKAPSPAAGPGRTVAQQARDQAESAKDLDRVLEFAAEYNIFAKKVHELKIGIATAKRLFSSESSTWEKVEIVGGALSSVSFPAQLVKRGAQIIQGISGLFGPGDGLTAVKSVGKLLKAIPGSELLVPLGEHTDQTVFNAMMTADLLWDGDYRNALRTGWDTYTNLEKTKKDIVGIALLRPTAAGSASPNVKTQSPGAPSGPGMASAPSVSPAAKTLADLVKLAERTPYPNEAATARRVAENFARKHGLTITWDAKPMAEAKGSTGAPTSTNEASSSASKEAPAITPEGSKASTSAPSLPAAPNAAEQPSDAMVRVEPSPNGGQAAAPSGHIGTPVGQTTPIGALATGAVNSARPTAKAPAPVEVAKSVEAQQADQYMEDQELQRTLRENGHNVGITRTVVNRAVGTGHTKVAKLLTEAARAIGERNKLAFGALESAGAARRVLHEFTPSEWLDPIERKNKLTARTKRMEKSLESAKDQLRNFNGPSSKAKVDAAVKAFEAEYAKEDPNTRQTLDGYRRWVGDYTTGQVPGTRPPGTPPVEWTSPSQVDHAATRAQAEISDVEAYSKTYATDLDVAAAEAAGNVATTDTAYEQAKHAAEKAKLRWEDAGKTKQDSAGLHRQYLDLKAEEANALRDHSAANTAYESPWKPAKDPLKVKWPEFHKGRTSGIRTVPAGGGVRDLGHLQLHFDSRRRLAKATATLDAGTSAVAETARMGNMYAEAKGKKQRGAGSQKLADGYQAGHPIPRVVNYSDAQIGESAMVQMHADVNARGPWYDAETRVDYLVRTHRPTKSLVLETEFREFGLVEDPALREDLRYHTPYEMRMVLSVKETGEVLHNSGWIKNIKTGGPPAP